MTTTNAAMEAELERLFARFDTDSSGYIDEAEFRAILQLLGSDSPREVLSLEFDLIDNDNDGKVGFREFADWWLDSNQQDPA